MKHTLSSKHRQSMLHEMSEEERTDRLAGWQKAIKQAQTKRGTENSLHISAL